MKNIVTFHRTLYFLLHRWIFLDWIEQSKNKFVNKA